MKYNPEIRYSFNRVVIGMEERYMKRNAWAAVVCMLALLVFVSCESTSPANSTNPGSINVKNMTDYTIKRLYFKPTSSSSYAAYEKLGARQLAPWESSEFVVEPGSYDLGAVFYYSSGVRRGEILGKRVSVVAGEKYEWILSKTDVSSYSYLGKTKKETQ